MNENKELLVCSNCGQAKPDVELTEDPFNAEINDDHTLVLLCNKCCEESMADI